MDEEAKQTYVIYLGDTGGYGMGATGGYGMMAKSAYEYLMNETTQIVEVRRAKQLKEGLKQEPPFNPTPPVKEFKAPSWEEAKILWRSLITSS
jgi:hypothetical protein